MARSAVYTTPAKVASLLQVPSFTAETKPSLSEVEEFIIRAEDFIEIYTGTAWRAISVTNEYHDYWGVIPVPIWHAYNLVVLGTAYVKARHRPLRPFVSGTDKIELWDGSQWVDLALAANGYTEGRGDDYYIDYDQGIIYFVGKKPAIGRNTVRLTYTYGYSDVALDIEEAATKIAAAEVIAAQDKTVLVAEGGGYAPLPVQKMGEWKEKVKEILARHKDIASVTR